MVTVGKMLGVARQMGSSTFAVRGPRGTFWALVGLLPAGVAWEVSW